MYESGQGVGRDQARATRLYRQAFDHYRQECDRGTWWACSSLGEMYEGGKGVAVDLAQAAPLFEKACSNGWGFGCARLGWLYEKGKGVQQDQARSARLYRLGVRPEVRVGLRTARIGAIIVRWLEG